MKWKTSKMGDIALSIQPGPFGSQLHSSDYSDAGTPIIMPKDMIDGHISHSNLVYVSDEHVERLSRHQVHAGNLMVARKGDVRKCVFITNNEEGWMTGSDCLKVALNEEKCVPKFIYYQLRSPYIGKWLETISIGATMPSINTGLLSGIELYLPDINTQKKISDVLSNYDELIQNNQKQIRLLEEAAQRLYKEWFVDLHFPGYEDVQIVDGMPEGWHLGTVQDVIVYHDTKRKPLSGEQREKMKGDYRYYGAAGVLDYVDSFLFDGTYLLLGEDGTVITDEGYPVLQYVTGKFWVNNHAHVLTGKGKYSTEFIYMMFAHMKISDVVTGVAQPKISQGRLSAKKILIPEDEIALTFQNHTKQIFDRILVLENQIKELKEARDRLLPKLMSGEIEL